MFGANTQGLARLLLNQFGDYHLHWFRALKPSLIINYGPHPWVSIFVCQGKVRLCAIGQIALVCSPAFAPRVGWAFTSVQSNQCVATATQGGLMLQTMLLTSSSSSESVRRQLLPSVPQPTAVNAVHTV